ncbi:MAG: peptidoglycan DD-metalloendopeptidase family protein [Ignavibacteriaceae bacterium]|nr:peptidoglycan DD-metalloendopeptidase family protein [Ignavibacteriaceae bacterium]
MRVVSFLLVVYLLGGELYGQSVDAKKQELDSLRALIKETEQQLKEKQKEERQTLSTIELYTKQGYLLGKLVAELGGEIKNKTQAIELLSRQSEKVTARIDSLRDQYRSYVVTVYKGIPDNEWVYIFSSSSLTEAAYRYHVLKRITRSGKLLLGGLQTEQKNLERLAYQLEDEKKTKEILLADRNNEEKELKDKIKERKTLLTKIKKDNAALKKDLETKKQNEKLIAKLIDKLIAAEAKRKKEYEAELARKKKEEEELAAKKNKETKPEKKPKETIVKKPEPEEKTDYYNLPGNAEFTKLRGKMMWPVKQGVIIRKFGENKNAKLKTVTLNYGIDIQSKAAADVMSVHDGVVSVIDWLPGYGSVVIISHSQDYRTVYGHMNNISIKEGEKVKKGTVMGKVGESAEGYILHFQVWNDRDNQNPENWLARR